MRISDWSSDVCSSDLGVWLRRCQTPKRAEAVSKARCLAPAEPATWAIPLHNAVFRLKGVPWVPDTATQKPPANGRAYSADTSIRVSNLARCTEKNVRKLRTLACAVKARCARAWRSDAPREGKEGVST